jgi:hypothetical protein
MEEELKALRLKKKILEIELRSINDQIKAYMDLITTDDSVLETERLKTEEITRKGLQLLILSKNPKG